MIPRVAPRSNKSLHIRRPDAWLIDPRAAGDVLLHLGLNRHAKKNTDRRKAELKHPSLFCKENCGFLFAVVSFRIKYLSWWLHAPLDCVSLGVVVLKASIREMFRKDLRLEETGKHLNKTNAKINEFVKHL